jgi:hypothetical protein
MSDQINLTGLVTIEPGTNGKQAMALVVMVEIADGKIVSSSLVADYHFYSQTRGEEHFLSVTAKLKNMADAA